MMPQQRAPRGQKKAPHCGALRYCAETGGSCSATFRVTRTGVRLTLQPLYRRILVCKVNYSLHVHYRKYTLPGVSLMPRLALPRDVEKGPDLRPAPLLLASQPPGL